MINWNRMAEDALKDAISHEDAAALIAVGPTVATLTDNTAQWLVLVAKELARFRYVFCLYAREELSK